MEPHAITQSLAQGLPEQQARVRDIIAVYRALPDNAGWPASLLMTQSLQRAERAAAEGDVVAMAIAYTDLSGYKM